MNGGHGRVVQQHAAKEFKQGQEHVRMMLQTSASHLLSKKVVSCLQLIGDHGQVALQHAVMASRQEQEHALTIKEAPLTSQKPTKKVAIFNHVVSDIQSQKQSKYVRF